MPKGVAWFGVRRHSNQDGVLDREIQQVERVWFGRGVSDKTGEGRVGTPTLRRERGNSCV